MVLQVPERQKLSGIIFNEPLSPSTESKRRALLFTASFSILLAVYGLEVTKTPWLDITVPDGAPNILHGAMSVALVYTLAVYALQALADLRRWFAAGDLMHLHSYFDLMLKSHNYLNAISQWVDKEPPQEENKREAIRRMRDEAAAFLDNLENEILNVRKSHAKLSALQWTRLVVFDLGVPLGLGVFALIKIGPALLPFLAVVIE